VIGTRIIEHIAPLADKVGASVDTDNYKKLAYEIASAIIMTVIIAGIWGVLKKHPVFLIFCFSILLLIGGFATFTIMGIHASSAGIHK
jgi:hypothetical protein